MTTSEPTDTELLSAWVRQRDEAAFRALAGRYANLVHMAARRTCRDEVLSADASQLVFILLARKAPSLLRHPSLAGWLHVAAVRTTRDLIKKSQREARKLNHYQQAMELGNDPFSASWGNLQPVLDSALADLSGRDREALLLRFYRALSVKEVAHTLGVTAAAAQKRIDRALERLRRKLVLRGCAVETPLAAALLAGFATDAQAAIPAVSQLAGKAIAAGAAGSGGFACLPTLPTTAVMKTSPAFVPATVLLAGGILLAGQFRAIATLEEAHARMGNRLTVKPTRQTTERSAQNIPTALDRQPVDWAEVARLLRVNKRFNGIIPNARLILQLGEMPIETLLESLDEIDLARLTESDRTLLQQHLGQELANRGSPRLALDRFLSVYGVSSWKWNMGRYFKTWMKQSPGEAIAWLSQNIDQMNNLSSGFLDISLHPLLESSPETAGRLLDAIPPERRLESMRSMGIKDFSPAQQIAWAELVRAKLTEKDRIQGITWPTLRWADGDGAPMPLPEISEYLRRIQPSRTEHEACVLAAAQDRPELSSVDVDSLASSLVAFRSWVEEFDPALVDKTTGMALAYNYPFMEENIISLILGYHARFGKDDVLVPLIEYHTENPNGNKDTARRFAEALRDETLRLRYLQSTR